MSSQVRIIENAQKVYKNQVTDKDILIKAGLAREEKLKQELETLKKRIKMMDTTSTLDQILDSGRTFTTKFSLGFIGDKTQANTVFVRASAPEPDIP